MILKCKACSAPLEDEDIDLARGFAKCRYCRTVMSFSMTLKDAATDETPAAPAAFRERPEVPLPDGIQLEDWGGSFRIVRRWFALHFVFLLFFCIAWDSFLIFWYSMAGNAPWIFKVFPIAHVAVGAGLTYYTVAGFVNRTVIEAAMNQLRVWHGPIPWPGNCVIPTSDLEQLYCQMDVHHRSNSGPGFSYRMNAILAGGKKIKLVSGLTDADQALFIEQQIEKRLGIADRAVGGELPR